MSERRSSRTNKGQHPKRDLSMYLEEEKKNYDQSKKIKTDDSDYVEQAQSYKADPDDEIVRCTPCGTNQDNYDEETDTGGEFVQCDECNTWQHSKCMGFKSNKEIPEQYQCNVCDPTLLARNNAKSAKKQTTTKSQPKSQTKSQTKPQEPLPTGIAALVHTLKSDSRISTAKAYFNYFQKSLDHDNPDKDNEKKATEWALHVEDIIFKTYPDKKYIEGGRRILFLLKKHFMRDILDGSLTFEQLVKKTPKEINRDIEIVEAKVKGNIKNIILTANEPSDIVRRTHKGDIIRENENDHEYGIEQNITTRSVDHRRFEEENENMKAELENQKINYQKMNPRINNDDDDEDDNNGHVSETEDKMPNGHESPEHVIDIQKSVASPANPESKSSGSSDLENVHDINPDEDLYPILTGFPKEREPAQSLTNFTKVWNGKITFPDFASFSAYGEFYSSSDFDEYSTPQELEGHISVCRDILNRSAYQIEGRLDRYKADSYLNKIISTRNLFLIEIKPSGDEEEEQFQKLYKYLLIKNKVGVLSHKPWFVKDSYLIPVDFRDEQLPYYLKSQRQGMKIGLFALYSVKQDYKPSGHSTFQSKTTEINDSYTPSISPSVATTELSQIMSQLGG